MFQQLQLAVCSFGEDGSAKGLHYFLHGDRLPGELILCRARRWMCQAWDSRLEAEARACSPDQTESSHTDGLKIRVSEEQSARNAVVEPEQRRTGW